EEKVHRTRIACYLKHTPGRPALRQVFFEEWVPESPWSADGKRLLIVSKKIVRVWDVPSGVSLATLLHPEEVQTAQFTPDGTHVLTVAGPAIWTWDTRSGRTLGPPLIDWEGFLQQPLSLLPQTPLQFLSNVGVQQGYFGQADYVSA